MCLTADTLLINVDLSDENDNKPIFNGDTHYTQDNSVRLLIHILSYLVFTYYIFISK